MESSGDQHWAVLSLTRFVLALIVLSGHIYSEINGCNDWTYFGLWLNQGSAVFGFLILSGYSIAASVEGSSSGFYRRRVIRIWPMYLLSIALALAVTAKIGGAITLPRGLHLGAPTWAQVIGSLMMLQGIATKPIAIDGQLWTLAVEWWLYMAAPLLKKLPTLVVAILAMGSLYADIVMKPGDASSLMNGESLLCLAWYWLVGFLYYRHRGAILRYWILLPPIIVALLSGVFIGRAVMIGVLAVALGSYIRVPGRLIRSMTWLGDLSYPLYCVHGPILALGVFFHIYSSWLLFAAVFAASAMALHLVDLPVRRWATKSRVPLTRDLVSIDVKA